MLRKIRGQIGFHIAYGKSCAEETANLFAKTTGKWISGKINDDLRYFDG